MRVGGYQASGEMDYYPIIGVVKDFNFESQKNQIAPSLWCNHAVCKASDFFTLSYKTLSFDQIVNFKLSVVKNLSFCLLFLFLLQAKSTGIGNDTTFVSGLLYKNGQTVYKK